MPDYTVIVTAEFVANADDLFDAVRQVLADLQLSRRVPVSLKTEVTENA